MISEIRKKARAFYQQELMVKYEVFRLFKPLAIGVTEEVIKAYPDIDPSICTAAVGMHVMRIRYKESVARGGRRWKLNGDKSDKVSSTHARRSARRFKEEAADETIRKTLTFHRAGKSLRERKKSSGKGGFHGKSTTTRRPPPSDRNADFPQRPTTPREEKKPVTTIIKKRRTFVLPTDDDTK